MFVHEKQFRKISLSKTLLTGTVKYAAVNFKEDRKTSQMIKNNKNDVQIVMTKRISAKYKLIIFIKKIEN
jgi:hypothetical protein